MSAQDTGAPLPDLTGVEETIIVPDRDLEPAEMAAIMRKVARVLNFLGGNIMRHAALTTRERVAGAGHPIVQAILAAAAQADQARMALDGPSQIMAPEMARVFAKSRAQ